MGELTCRNAEVGFETASKVYKAMGAVFERNHMKKRLIEAAVLVLGVIIMIFKILNLGTKDNGGFILQAHRGWSEYYPENTLESFEAAAKCEQFDAIETDVQETADGYFVLIHDKKLKRTTGMKGKIADYTLQEVREFAIVGGNNIEKYPDERVPLLEEYLDICKNYDKIPYIEMKSLTDAGIARLLEALEDGGWKDSCVLTSFRFKYIECVRNLTDEFNLQYMLEEEQDVEEALEMISGMKNVGLRPNAYVVTKKDIRACKKKGVQVECWGLETGDKVRYLWLKKNGVQGGTCNDWKGLK